MLKAFALLISSALSAPYNTNTLSDCTRCLNSNSVHCASHDFQATKCCQVHANQTAELDQCMSDYEYCTANITSLEI